MKRPLNKEEVRWIQNERKLCAIDFRYWTQYAWIIDWHKNPVHPTLNVAQNIVVDVWGEHEERAIANIIMAKNPDIPAQATQAKLAKLRGTPIQ